MEKCHFHIPLLDRVFKIWRPTILVNTAVYKPQPHLSQEVANSQKYLHLHSVFQMLKTKNNVYIKTLSGFILIIHILSKTHCILISGYLQTKRLKKSKKETSLSNSDSDCTQLKYRKLMRKLHKELCKPEQLLARTLLSSCSKMVCGTSKAIIHYPVKYFIYFHHAMKQMEQRGMDHKGTSTAEPQNKKFQKLPTSFGLASPVHMCILKMS